MIDFDAKNNVTHHFSGRFEPPGNDWIHLTRQLNDYELMIVTKGTLYIGDENREFCVNEGEYLLMPPCQNQHGTKKGAATFYWLHFGYHDEQNDHTMTDETKEGHITFPVTGRLPQTDRIVILLKQLMDSEHRYRDALLSSFLTGAILCELSDSLKKEGNPYHKKSEQLIDDINDYISWHLQENPKVSDLAAYFGYNEKYLTTLYRRLTGIPLKTYLLNERITRAKALLTETSLPVSDIAYSLGWQDTHNFSNSFRHITGMTPTGWRESYTKHFVFNK